MPEFAKAYDPSGFGGRWYEHREGVGCFRRRAPTISRSSHPAGERGPATRSCSTSTTNPASSRARSSSAERTARHA